MALYWIAYDLDQPGQDYTDLIKRLKQWGAKRILKSDWLLARSGTTPETIRNDLQQDLESNDRIMIAELKKNAAWEELLISDDDAVALFKHVE